MTSYLTSHVMIITDKVDRTVVVTEEYTMIVKGKTKY